VSLIKLKTKGVKMKYIYKWNGEYFGFISGDNFFDANSNWVGWIEGSQVWQANGEFLGEIYEDNYILRKTTMISPVPRVPRVSPVPPVPPVHPVNRIGKVPLAVLEDALKGL